MRYRWKLLILLLAISVVPIIVSNTITVRAVTQFGDKITSQMRENLIASAEKRLRLLVDTYSSWLWQGRERMEMALMFQAREVERRLAKDSPLPSKVYFAKDFDKERDLPHDVIPSPLHFRFLAGDKMELLKVSYLAQVFKLAPGVKKDEVTADIARLSGMTPIYKALFKRLQGSVSWHYTSLENGLHSAYPGHGGIPRGLDPRKQSWYRNAVEMRGHATSWSEAYVDPETRQIVFAATMPLKRPNGEIAGVTALVLPISNLFESKLLLRNIPQETSYFMISSQTMPKTGKRGARIITSNEHTEMKYRGWHAQAKTYWLISSDDKQIQTMLDDVEAEASNIRRMPYKGRDSLWVYGPVNVRSGLVLITPYEEILKPAQRTEGYIQIVIDNLVGWMRYGLLVIVLLVVVLAFSFSRTVTKPIQALADGARGLAKGRFDAQVSIRSRDEFGDVGHVFNSIGPRLKEHYQMRQSLELAMEVQQNLLPKADPKVEGLDIAGISIYCDEIGGDYYDFLDVGELERGEIGVVVGDVSGHGIPSALLMATARASLRQRSSLPGSMARIVSDLNIQLTKDVEESGQFMTLFYLTIDPAKQNVRWVRAGHDPAIIYDPATDSFEDLRGPGVALGVDECWQYSENMKTGLAEGQIIVLGTDGIWEAHNPKGEMFGKDRLNDVIRRNSTVSAKRIVDAIIDTLHRFQKDQEPEDDVTLVVIKINGEVEKPDKN
ncbi:MAG: SpoIIE family protein phosphatase [Deltaproteobacteria bacterium]|nr:MAG: SpoIIE family protein phosphatase [Deltaproteobacteria bacterium]